MKIFKGQILITEQPHNGPSHSYTTDEAGLIEAAWKAAERNGAHYDRWTTDDPGPLAEEDGWTLAEMEAEFDEHQQSVKDEQAQKHAEAKATHTAAVAAQRAELATATTPEAKAEIEKKYRPILNKTHQAVEYSKGDPIGVWPPTSLPNPYRILREKGAVIEFNNGDHSDFYAPDDPHCPTEGDWARDVLFHDLSAWSERTYEDAIAQGLAEDGENPTEEPEENDDE